MLFVIFVLIFVLLIIAYVNLRRKPYKQYTHFDMVVRQYNSYDDFLASIRKVRHRYSLRPKTQLVATNDIYRDRVYGAYTLMAKGELWAHLKDIKAKKYQRSSDIRRKVYVPGYKSVKPLNVGQRVFFPYHKTHLLPFRYVLSEGDTLRNILVTGTSLANSGDAISYTLSDKQREARLQRLSALLGKGKNTFDYLIDDKGRPYSLDDYERLSTKLILEAPSNDTQFLYIVLPQYSGANIIPRAFKLELYQIGRRRKVFSAIVRNA